MISSCRSSLFEIILFIRWLLNYLNYLSSLCLLHKGRYRVYFTNTWTSCLMWSLLNVPWLIWVADVPNLGGTWDSTSQSSPLNGMTSWTEKVTFECKKDAVYYWAPISIRTREAWGRFGLIATPTKHLECLVDNKLSMSQQEEKQMCTVITRSESPVVVDWFSMRAAKTTQELFF